VYCRHFVYKNSTQQKYAYHDKKKATALIVVTRLTMKVKGFIMRIYWAITLCLLGAFFSGTSMAQVPEKQKAINSLEELSIAIDQIRVRTNTQGVAVGVVQAGQPNWLYYSGIANIKSKIPLNDNSQFRFGSISKMFVALSLLKLEEEGKLSLNDKLQTLAPEIEFTNPWEATEPLRVVHLLNHSSGWDSPHFNEQKALSATPIAIIDALNTHPHSRLSRWKPGSRMAYNNTGFLAGAYIVEKITGEVFESYVRRSFFQPLSMDSSGYYFSDTYRESAVSLYINKQEQPYRHLNNRAAGGLNSTMGDMLSFAQFLVNEENTNIISQNALESFRMPTGTLAAEKGLSFGWGLGNQLFHANGVALYGHEGSLRGASAMLIYNPEYQFGYVIAANNNSPAVSQIHRLVSHYLTKDITVPNVKAEREVSQEDKALSGWYKNAAPISATYSIISTIVPWQLQVGDTSSTIKPLIGSPARILIPDADKGFKQNTTGLTVLLPIKDSDFGDGIYYGPQTLIKTNIVSALLPLLVIVFWILMALSSVLFLLIWLPRYLFKKSITSQSVAYRSWPLLSLFIAIVTLICLRIITSSPSIYSIAGSVSLLSVLILVGSIGFLVSAVWSVWMWYKHRKLPINSFTKWHTTLFTVANLLLLILLLSNGLIGLRLWA
jgi:CubicO group peptidase (beta-lactamase class C family)